MSRTVRTRIACMVTAALVISWGGPAANAFWQTLSSNAGAAQADFIPAVPAPTASVSAASAAVSWVQGSTAAGRPVAGYTVARYASATDGTQVAAGGGCAGTITALACTESGLPSGTWYYTVTPILGAWQGVESTRSQGVTAVDTTPPSAPTITAPAVISGPTVASGATADKVPVSGTAEAGSSVTITVEDAGAAHSDSQTVTADSSGQWAAANFNLTTFTDGTITYTAVATDAAGNASAPGTATSSKDATAPKVTNLMLVNGGSNNNIDPGDQVVLTFSEALDPSTICSNWSPTGGDQTVNGSEQVTVSVSTDDTLTVTGPGCATAGIGSVTLDANYAVAGALSFHGTGIDGSKVSSLAWNATTFQLTITLGSREGTPSSVSQPGNHRYNPATGLTDSVGNALSTLTYTGPRSKF
jgi:hypothetical protein